MNRFLGQAEEENSKNKIREKGTICFLLEYINPRIHTMHDPMIQTDDQLTIPEQQIFNLMLFLKGNLQFDAGIQIYIHTYLLLLLLLRTLISAMNSWRKPINVRDIYILMKTKASNTQQ